MGKLKSVLTFILIIGLMSLPSGCANNGAASGSTSASIKTTSTGSVTSPSNLTQTTVVPSTMPTSTMPLTSVAPTPSTGTAVTTTVPVKLDHIGAYLVVIDHLIDNRTINASNRKYLAVDTTRLPNLTPEDKSRLFQGLEKYGFQLLDKTFTQLKAEGYIEKSFEFKNGAWIDLKDIRMDGLTMTLDAGIHLGGLDAYGLDDMRVSYVGTHWEISKINMTWVA